MVLDGIDAVLAGQVAQHVGAVAVGAHEDVGPEQRAVDVGLGREVDDGVVAGQGGGHRLAVADVAHDQLDALAVEHAVEVGE